MLKTEFIDLPALTAVSGSITLPGSKSISNRALLLAALCQGRTVLRDVLDSDDTRVMLGALRALGCCVEQDGLNVTVDGLGAGGARAQQADLFMGNAGTAIRPLTAALAVLGGDYTLRGVPRMHERPIGDLVDALRQLGCRIDYLGQDGYPPLRIGQPALRLGAPIQVRGDVSSQFLTALLMALPLVAQQDVVIEVVGELISKPYIDITLRLLQRFGVTVVRQDWQRFTIPAGAQLRSPGELYVEADASSASYFIAAAAISESAGSQKGLKILGVGADSIQGDIRFVDAAQRMGAVVDSGPNWLHIRCGVWPLKAIDLDCNAIPDAAMTLAVMALYADGPCRLRNIGSWRVKETDRIAAMCAELRKLGAEVESGPDWLRVHPIAPGAWRAASLATYDDHRMAMCLSLAAFNPQWLPVRIQDPKCVAKTFPEYFEALFALAQTEAQHIPVICVDGPTASGKGTLAAALAQALGYHLLDSGALYRITALAAQQAGLATDGSAASAIAALVPTLDIRFEGDRIRLGTQDVTEAIRAEVVGSAASRIAALAPVRDALVDLQHRFRRVPGLVADGRDMGTVIFPNAALKVFLTANVEQRAQRRYQQLIAKGNPVTLDSLRADLQERDARDTQRSVAPLVAAQDALLLDNSAQTVEQSVAQVLTWWQERRPF
ncbi:MAG: hypothetical protein Fur007_20920 [Rhodoferax sp.]